MTVMRKRTVLFGLLALVLALALQSWPGTSHQSVAHAAGTYTSAGVSPTSHPWLGYGLNEYPVMRDSTDADAAWTTANLNLTTSRLSYIKPGLTRINFYRDWFNSSGVVGTYDWTSSVQIQDTWQILDYYKAQGYPVQVGLWNNDAFYDTTDFATLQADLVNELINVKGYTNIKYYAATNEPNFSFTLPQWATMMSNLYAAFQSRGLPTSLLVGPDTSNYSWTDRAAQGQRQYLSGYEYHTYPTASEVTSGSLIGTLSYNVYEVDSNDTANKPVYLSEMGVSGPDYNPNPAINTYAYGLDMFDYGIQAALAGESSAMAWCVDGFDHNKNCGMWDISGLNGGTTLRPWFYSWSLLNRYFPSNATIYSMNAPANVRIVAASVPAGTKDHWSFALVNQNTTDQSVTLQVPGWGSGSFNEYVYSSGGNPTDGNGFPVPTAQISTASGGLAQGLTVDVPAGSGVVLTTLDGSPLSPGVTITDNLTNWNNVYSHTANLTFDTSNPAYFDQDASRVKRATNTAENMVYKIDGGITNFAVTGYYYNAYVANSVSFATSPDDVHWTSLAANMSPPTATEANWYQTTFTPGASIPSGSAYLQITLANDANIYSPQPGQVNVSGNPTTLTDSLADWSQTFNHSANWKFDSSSPQYFNGDTTRVTRTTNTAETIVWHRPGVTSFSANVEFCCTSHFLGTVTMETSPDGTTWTTLPTSSSPPTSTGNGGAWYSTTYTPNAVLPGGTNYLRLTFANDANIWSPQLLQMFIVYA